MTMMAVVGRKSEKLNDDMTKMRRFESWRNYGKEAGKATAGKVGSLVYLNDLVEQIEAQKSGN